eukprot:scaffold1531_cov296-Prasinococcus_capsulatus_cf.AAC.3
MRVAGTDGDVTLRGLRLTTSKGSLRAVREGDVSNSKLIRLQVPAKGVQSTDRRVGDRLSPMPVPLQSQPLLRHSPLRLVARRTHSPRLERRSLRAVALTAPLGAFELEASAPSDGKRTVTAIPFAGHEQPGITNSPARNDTCKVTMLPRGSAAVPGGRGDHDHGCMQR